MKLRYMLLLAAAVTVSACGSSRDNAAIEKWTKYSEKVLASGEPQAAFERIDRAFAAGDEAALAGMFADPLYYFSVDNTWVPVALDKRAAIAQQVETLRTCGLVGKTERVFEIAGNFNAIGLRHAQYAKGAKENGFDPKLLDREKVLPADGMWFQITPAADIGLALERCAGERDLATIVIAPMGGTWKIVGFDPLKLPSAKTATR